MGNIREKGFSAVCMRQELSYRIWEGAAIKMWLYGMWDGCTEDKTWKDWQKTGTNNKVLDFEFGHFRTSFKKLFFKFQHVFEFVIHNPNKWENST